MKKKKTKKELIKEEIENDFLLFTFLLATASMMMIALQKYSFNIGIYAIPFSVFVLPVLIFICNYITKKLGFKKALGSIMISSLILLAFLILIYDLVRREIDIIDLASNVLSYFICLFVNLLIYYYVITNLDEKIEGIFIYIEYIFVIMIFFFVFMSISNNMVMTDNDWVSYSISIIIEAILSIVAVFIDNKIKRGLKL